MTDFHNSFTDTFSRKLAIKLLIEIPIYISVSIVPRDLYIVSSPTDLVINFCSRLLYVYFSSRGTSPPLGHNTCLNNLPKVVKVPGVS